MSKLSKVSKHYLLMEYYLLSFTYVSEYTIRIRNLITKELTRRINNGKKEEGNDNT